MFPDKKQVCFSYFNLVGIGVDIENISRFEKLNPSSNGVFLKKIFTAKEIEYCFSKKFPAASLAARFSGKEAVFKAFGGAPGKRGLPFNKIEILPDKSGKPKAIIKDRRFDNFKILISLSHSETAALAFAVIHGT